MWPLLYFFHLPHAWVTNIFIYTVQYATKLYTMLTETQPVYQQLKPTQISVCQSEHFKTSSVFQEPEKCPSLSHRSWWLSQDKVLQLFFRTVFFWTTSWSVWVTFSIFFNSVYIIFLIYNLIKDCILWLYHWLSVCII